MIPLVDFIQQLEAVARANDDKFEYSIILVPNGTLRVGFIVREEADGHEVLFGTGASIDEAVANVQDGWQECLKDFGYEVKENI